MSIEESPVRTLPLHANGHVMTRENEAEVEVLFFSGFPGMEDHEPMVQGLSYTCAMCGEWPTLRVTGEGVFIDSPCPCSEGIITVVTLEVPSGKILVADNLRDIYRVDRTGMADYNTPLGQAQYIKAMAGVGCAYGPVGNSCPGLWRTGPDSYVIARMPYDEDDDLAKPEPPGAERLAGICTDLWAYCVADYEDWLRRGGEPQEVLGWSYDVVEVPPGTYRFTHHTGELDFDHDADHLVFAHIERIA